MTGSTPERQHFVLSAEVRAAGAGGLGGHARRDHDRAHTLAHPATSFLAAGMGFGAVLRLYRREDFPAGTHAFFRPLARTQNATFAVGPEGDGLEMRLEARAIRRRTPRQMAKQFINTTDLLKKMLERDHMTPNPADLSGVLSSGVFRQQDQRVTGEWPIDRSFVEALFSGKVE